MNIKELDDSLINEAIRAKGPNFDLLKNADPMQQEIIKKTQMGIALSQQKNGLKVSTTSTGKDIVDSQLKSRVDQFDKERAETILKSDHIVEEYNLWIEGQIDKIMTSFNKYLNINRVYNINREAINGSITLASDLARELYRGGVPENKIRDYLKGTFFYQTEDPEEIKHLLTARLNYCKKITSLLQQMLTNNYKILGLTENEMKMYTDDLNNSPRSVRDLRLLIIKNKDKFITNNGECIDLTSLGFGKIFITTTHRKDLIGALSLQEDPESGTNTNFSAAIDSFLQKAMIYECVVLSHGADMTRLGYNINARINDYIVDKSEKKSDFIKGKLPKFTNYDKAENKGNLLRKRWMMQPIRSDKSGYFTDMSAFIRQLIKEGYKKILIAACNPGSHKLDKDIMDTPGVTINYSDFSNLMENGTGYDDYDYDLLNDMDMSIYDGEQELIQLAESYGLNYYDIDIDNMVINESIKDTIKTYAHKVVSFIIGLFKKAWEFLKRIVNNLKERFSKLKSAKSKKKINISLALTEAAQNKKFTIDSTDDLKKLVTQSCNSIQKELQKRQKDQINISRKLEMMTSKIKETSQKESFEYTDDLVEFLGYNKLSTLDILTNISENKLAAIDRKKLPDSVFGVPEKRKFPLNDRAHVIAAIKFFNRADDEDKEYLAKRIKAAMKKYNISDDKIGKKNELRKYLNLEESVDYYDEFAIMEECVCSTTLNKSYLDINIDKYLFNIEESIEYCKDEDGIFIFNEDTKYRTSSFKEPDDIPEEMIEYIKNK